MREPYLSIVIATRNDEHGGNTLQRTQTSLDNMLDQLESRRIETELVLIEWNPPNDKPLLRDAVKWPSKLDYCTIRVITVPSAIHLKYGYPKEHPMKIIVAYNAGFRRARGRFILQSTIDTLYSDELMDYIAFSGLKEDEIYHINRTEVNKDVVYCSAPKERLDYCKNNVIRVNVQIPRIMQLVFYRGLPTLLTNACGDFQLMSKHYWHLLRGYAETEAISAHIDTLMSYASYTVGVREIVLENPMYLYHIDHDNKFNDIIKRSVVMDGWMSLLFIPFRKQLMQLHYGLAELVGFEVRSSLHGVPVLDSTKCRRMCREIIAGRRPYIFNDEDWGLGQELLEEYIVNEH